MRSIIYKITCFILPLLFVKVAAQSPSFYHLTTANGLSDNNIRSLTIDKNGFLWVGTEDGLNVYDGHSITTFTTEKHPQLPSNTISLLYCDKFNRIWAGTTGGICLIDEKRAFQKVILHDSVVKYTIKAIVETETKGLILFTDKGNFSPDNNTGKWNKLPELPGQLAYRKTRNIQHFTRDQCIYVTDSMIAVYDHAATRMVYQLAATDVLSVCRISDNELAVGRRSGMVDIIDTRTSQVLNRYAITDESKAKTVTATPIAIKKAANGDLIIDAGYEGLVILTKQGTLQRCIHDPVNPQSIIGNTIYRIHTGNNGEVIAGTTTSGVSMYNTMQGQAQHISFFADEAGNYYDNFTGPMTEDRHGLIWIGAYDRLIRWNRTTNRAAFFYYLRKDSSGQRRGDIRGLCFDRMGRLWVSVLSEGIAVFHEATGQFRKITLDTATGQAVKSMHVPDLYPGSDGMIWACSNLGIYTIDPASFKVNTFSQHPLLKQLDGKRVNSLFEDSRGRVWISTIGYGVYCYDKTRNLLEQYTTKEGLVSDICYMVAEDRKGRFYIPASTGLSIIDANGIRSLTRGNGLRYDRCESVVIDNEGIAWISNKKCIIRLDADRNKLDFFDDNARVSNEGFRVGSYLKAGNGELIWGGYRGISYYHPSQLRGNGVPLQLTIYQAQLHDSIIRLSNAATIRMPYADNRVTFQFAATHLGIPGKTYYQYKLEGFDREWQKGENPGQARYTLLSPGNYTFNVKASIDGIHWTDAQHAVSLVVIPPFWKRWWFFLICAWAIGGSVYWLVRSRDRKIKRHKEELEREQAINYFASSMNEQQTVDAVLWDVAKNCIARLQFEDCVIYLLDEQRQMLVQKAAHGRKNPRQFEIEQPIEIPVGKGITGTVAATGRPELITDTSKDARYIIDDERRYSEIAVPIISGNRVVGVIDCEHSKKKFFTQKHLSILSTIASLCANKIVRTRAEDEKKQAEKTLMDTKQKMADVEMQALRAQMNPHFIFNCLNSINRYIVKSDQATASLYLTRFAKLIRLILENSNNKNVILSNELEALKLYIEMEMLRFDKKFNYSVTVDPGIAADSVELPPLIIQPYVENAIWHGLLHKETGGNLDIHISMIGDSMLECVVEDDGVGRERAKELKSKSATTRKSLGMKLTSDRISLLNKHAELNASVDIIDLTASDGQSKGTKVILRIPI